MSSDATVFLDLAPPLQQREGVELNLIAEVSTWLDPDVRNHKFDMLVPDLENMMKDDYDRPCVMWAEALVLAMLHVQRQDDVAFILSLCRILCHSERWMGKQPQIYDNYGREAFSMGMCMTFSPYYSPSEIFTVRRGDLCFDPEGHTHQCICEPFLDIPSRQYLLDASIHVDWDELRRVYPEVDSQAYILRYCRDHTPEEGEDKRTDLLVLAARAGATRLLRQLMQREGLESIDKVPLERLDLAAAVEGCIEWVWDSRFRLFQEDELRWIFTFATFGICNQETGSLRKIAFAEKLFDQFMSTGQLLPDIISKALAPQIIRWGTLRLLQVLFARMSESYKSEAELSWFLGAANLSVRNAAIARYLLEQTDDIDHVVLTMALDYFASQGKPSVLKVFLDDERVPVSPRVLQAALGAHRYDLVRWLLAHPRIDLNQDSLFWIVASFSPIHELCLMSPPAGGGEYGGRHRRMRESLLKHILTHYPQLDPNEKSTSGLTPLALCLKEGNNASATILLEYSSRTDISILCGEGNEETEEEEEEEEQEKQTAFHYITRDDRTAHYHRLESFLQMMRAFRRLHPQLDDINSFGVDGYTPLMRAARYNDAPFARELLQFPNIDVNLVSIELTCGGCGTSAHDTALHIAAREGSMEVISLLLQTGSVDVMKANTAGRAPLEEAVRKGHFVAYSLLAQYAKRNDQEVCSGALARDVFAFALSSSSGCHPDEDTEEECLEVLLPTTAKDPDINGTCTTAAGSARRPDGTPTVDGGDTPMAGAKQNSPGVPVVVSPSGLGEEEHFRWYPDSFQDYCTSRFEIMSNCLLDSPGPSAEGQDKQKGDTEGFLEEETPCSATNPSSNTCSSGADGNNARNRKRPRTDDPAAEQ